MPVSLEMHPPVAYAGWLWWVVAGLAAAAIALPLLVWFFTRMRAQPAQPVAQPSISPTTARDEALRAFAALRQQHAAGMITDKQAHQETSRVLRHFVAAVSGTPADALTLAELRDIAGSQPWLGSVAQFVEQVYPPNFAPDVTRPVDQTFAEAERMVTSWR